MECLNFFCFFSFSVFFSSYFSVQKERTPNARALLSQCDLSFSSLSFPDEAESE